MRDAITVVLHERVTARAWSARPLELARRIRDRLGLENAAAYVLELEQLAPVKAKRTRAVIVARYRVID